MKKIKFYICPKCGNIITSSDEADVSCCSRKLTALVPKSADDNHRITVKEIEYEYYVSFEHEMEKSHFITFAAFITSDTMIFTKLYPEQGSELRFPMYCRDGVIYFGCSRDGLFYSKTNI